MKTFDTEMGGGSLYKDGAGRDYGPATKEELLAIIKNSEARTFADLPWLIPKKDSPYVLGESPFGPRRTGFSSATWDTRNLDQSWWTAGWRADQEVKKTQFQKNLAKKEARDQAKAEFYAQLREKALSKSK